MGLTFLRHMGRYSATFAVGFALCLALPNKAAAVPSFARKYETSCQTCHTVYPMLNSFGEAFRRNGYRFPSQNGSTDSDVTKAPTIPLGQDEYIKTFPETVFPDKITQAVPLSLMVNGGVAFNFPTSDARDAAGHNFTWDGIVEELHLFAAGAFDDRVTYFGQLTLSADGVDIETAYVLWNDVLGRNHLLNLWAGRLMNPQLTSYGLHGSYLSDVSTPAVSLAGLYNPSGTFTLGQGHNDGVEANGIAGHRFGYAVGWLASMPTMGLSTPNAEDVYAHVGVKIGGMSLDGEGPGGTEVANVKRPWEETSLTLDVFGFHGLDVLDSGIGAPTPVPQKDRINAIGGALRLNVGSLLVNAGLQFEHHARPYQGSKPMLANPPSQPEDKPGTPDLHSANGYTQYDEVDYLIYPWLVPGVRLELTHLGMKEGTHASLVRILPGIAFLVRPNIKIVLVGDVEVARDLPPAGSWDAAGGTLMPFGTKTELVAEQINANVFWAF